MSLFTYLLLIQMMYIFKHMPPRRIRRDSSSTSGCGGAISSPSTSEGRSGVATSSTTDRHRPTASEQRRKAQQDPNPDPIEESKEDVASWEATDDDIIDEDAQPVILEERVDEDCQAGPIPRGWDDLSVLVSFKTHIAMSTWIGEVWHSFWQC